MGVPPMTDHGQDARATCLRASCLADAPVAWASRPWTDHGQDARATCLQGFCKSLIGQSGHFYQVSRIAISSSILLSATAYFMSGKQPANATAARARGNGRRRRRGAPHNSNVDRTRKPLSLRTRCGDKVLLRGAPTLNPLLNLLLIGTLHPPA